ncbi:P-loop containing nucleoside triphosphate hydrolase protein [Fomitiporia mediterranea MF3/22]|uniref:P-loop containing nucleoside triphosphate hydrolase protein n=1 Tax=Fomitiporia mediterranea (strain MF3/22) TaxID=694068 RepID=UPI0004407C48|nr:P-loop containing nucleoside triphosphate hydrolase protein [Fomitiporia mediterranea MF3/22]EJD05988.1 P-loop containing nucleoside triphosphate hydrolase protein [Fomitiporia mediterranea MF3/22]
MDALKSLVSPLVGGAASNSLVDGMKLVVLGGTVETARRISSSAWSSFVNSFFLTAHFSEEDYPYDWLMLWLSKRPEWQRSREFETTTRTISPGMMSGAMGDNSFGDDDYDGAEPSRVDDLTPGMAKTRVVFQPTPDSTHTIYYRGHWLRVRRSRNKDSDLEVLSVSVVARNNNILKQLVLQAKREYEAEAVHRIQIYFADVHGSWRWTDSRHKRPMESIVLEPGVKEMLLADTRDFLKSEKWYADRGIPFRRGYLLHGVPGSGKSSLIHAIAGALMLDIYVVSLSSSWMNDSTLTTLMGRVPARCIVLLEDLDAAFTRSTSRDATSTGAPGSKKRGGSNSSDNKDDSDDDDNEDENGKSKKKKKDDSLSEINTLSLSGLLNALDGVAASEGRILFATTNHLERLDPALSRPGRMDVWIEFKNASPWQAEALFRNFFPSAEEEESEPIVEREGELDGISLPSVPGTPTTTASSGSFSDISSLSISGSSCEATPSKAAATQPPRTGFGSQNTAYLPPPPDPEIAAASHSARPLSAESLSRLAKQFADSIPAGEFSVAALQGYLLKNKSRPEAAAEGAAAWVISEREMRERLQREREAREMKEKLEREQRRKEIREKREREARERAEKERKEREERARKEKEDREKVNNAPSSDVREAGPRSESSEPEAEAEVESKDGDEDGEEDC